jgi:hypothetical protein
MLLQHKPIFDNACFDISKIMRGNTSSTTTLVLVKYHEDPKLSTPHIIGFEITPHMCVFKFMPLYVVRHAKYLLLFQKFPI